MKSLDWIRQTILLSALKSDRKGFGLLADSILTVMADHGVLPSYVLIALGDMLVCGLVAPGFEGEVLLTEAGRHWAWVVERQVTDAAAQEAV